jgi:hypothetical protein
MILSASQGLIDAPKYVYSLVQGRVIGYIRNESVQKLIHIHLQFVNLFLNQQYATVFMSFPPCYYLYIYIYIHTL